MQKRLSRARLAKSRIPKMAEVEVNSEHSEWEDDEEYIPYVPPEEVIEPLYVDAVTTLPISAADAGIPTIWYGCRDCIRAFQSAQERDNHKAVHKESRNKEALQEGRYIESLDEEANRTEMNAEPREGILTTNPAEPDLSVVEPKPEQGSGFSGDLQLSKPTRGKIFNFQQPAELQCDICADTFSSRKDLKIHVVAHNLAKADKAIHLGNRNGKRKSLDLNSSFEEDETPYDDCDLPELKKRQNFTCEVCKKGFGHEHNLKRHAKSHVGSKEVTKSAVRSSILGEGTNSKRVLSRLGRKRSGVY